MKTQSRKLFVKLIFVFFVMLISTSCYHAPLRGCSGVLPLSDSISLIAVTPLDGTKLLANKPGRFLVRLQYSLNSYDSASLLLTLDEFPNYDSCISGAGRSVNSSVPVSSQRISISRGTRSIEVPMIWPGNQDEKNFARHTISLHGAMWVEQLNYEFLTRSFATQYCERISAPSNSD
jgi:hypothetical protein